MKKYQYLASWDDQTLTRVGEPVVVLGDSNVSQVEVTLPSDFLLDPTKAECRMYFMLPGKKESDHDVLETATKDDNGDSHVTWTIKHVHSQKGGRLAFSLTLIGDDAQWDSRTAIIPVYESRYQPESEEAEKPYTGRLEALEGSMAAIRGEFAEVQEDFEDLKETATLGTPIPESLVANMQEGHVYIYTGNETGYTAGHVYYYVGGALTDGGVYGGTTVDATLTQSGQAADAKVTGDKIAEIKEDLNTFDCSVLFKNGYTSSGGEKIGNFYENSGYVTALLHVEKGDVLTVTGIATVNARTWAFATADKTITRRAEATTIYNKTVLIAEEGEAYFVYNDAVPANPQSYLTIKINRIVTLEEIRGDIDAINDSISDIESAFDSTEEIAKTKRISNNLRTDGINNLLPFNALVYKNGTASESNYGLSGSKYLIDLGDFQKCHVRFAYRETAFYPYSGSNVFVSLASLGKNNALHVEELFQSITKQGGKIYRTSGHYPANRNSGSTLTLNPQFRKSLNGENAVVIYYIGDLNSTTSVNVVFTETAITFNVDNVGVGTVAINATDTIQDFSDAVSAISNFTCEIKNGNGTVGDLLLPVLTANLKESVSRNGQTVYGTYPIIIPFKVDRSWHTVEFIVDKDAQKAYVAYDGYTGKVAFTPANALTDGMLAIGGNYTSESGIEVKDLVVDINTYADCELLNGKITNASTIDTIQLISEINPRLMIFEGHGILAGTEKQAQEAYQASGSDVSNEAMQASTERLNIVFDELKNRGYVPVTMQEVVNWKKESVICPKDAIFAFLMTIASRII